MVLDGTARKASVSGIAMIRRHSQVRLLPYPAGKTFAFTIIDDTDMATLEVVRPIYDYLYSLGLRTTKTVWVTRPEGPPAKAADTGDTLEREDYAAYVRELRQRGFEIALHNVSSQSSKRLHIAAGIERFGELLGAPPRINVHHEKNQENLYFAFAQRGGHRPPPFGTATFQRLYQLLHQNGRCAAPNNHGCTGEDPRSEYFWGDLCRATFEYVRTNVFFQDLNTLKCNPLMPYESADTPYVKYWFDSSNGQDVDCFNSILSDVNVTALRKKQGCSILYTHFGKGFVTKNKGIHELNPETQRRLRAISGYTEGWYAPVGEVLDRLRAFQSVTLLPLPEGIVLSNRNASALTSVTLQAYPGTTYCSLSGEETATADSEGRIVLPSLPAGRVTFLVRSEASKNVRRWYEDRSNSWQNDVAVLARQLGTRWRRHA
jgi:hypothetical protein